MTSFEYHEPATLDEALALLREHGADAHPLAGGTSLILLMRQGLIQPGYLIGLRRLAALGGIGPRPDGGLEIGALATHRDIERSALVRGFFAPLAETFARVATVRIRNQATLGGNLAHADPAQDPPPILLALDAQVTAAGAGGTRTIPLDAFFRDFYETALEEGEIVTSVHVPPQPSGTRGTYVKFLPQSQDDYATISVAVVLRCDDGGTCRHARVALGAAGPVPLRARTVEAALAGKRLDLTTIRDASALVRDEVDPLDDVRGSAAYKREMARVWTERAIRRVAEEVAAA
ncbi:MAG: xanthine dehydrogenase family protein subunit M [Candidatus Eremiobacteraeota bacterium]|nr:xanthine dehydrogenase family protein subunit M [Candidatus Eremiobacteraeota bacterium]MBV8354801.1 xanthine dehydrogenase family protein subunit M [Candidatus Eremiobacteraeota bacterium]